jgi:hypothetical protein
MYFGAQGELIQPEYEDNFGVVAIFRSLTSEKFNLPLTVPDKIKQSVKVMNLAISGREYVAFNINKIDECGAVIGTGKTIQEAWDKCKRS